MWLTGQTVKQNATIILSIKPRTFRKLPSKGATRPEDPLNVSLITSSFCPLHSSSFYIFDRPMAQAVYPHPTPGAALLWYTLTSLSSDLLFLHVQISRTLLHILLFSLELLWESSLSLPSFFTTQPHSKFTSRCYWWNAYTVSSTYLISAICLPVMVLANSPLALLPSMVLFWISSTTVPVLLKIAHNYRIYLIIWFFYFLPLLSLHYIIQYQNDFLAIYD